jgi:hypothetical protein
MSKVTRKHTNVWWSLAFMSMFMNSFGKCGSNQRLFSVWVRTSKMNVGDMQDGYHAHIDSTRALELRLRKISNTQGVFLLFLV